MKKFILFLIIMYSYGFDAVCNVFSDVLQTRNNPSQITMSGNGYIYGSPSCALNTGSIYQSIWYPKLYCGSSTASASGSYGESLSIDYSFLIDSTSSTSSHPSSSWSSVTINSSTTLTNSEYNEIRISNWSSSTINVTANSTKINTLSLTTKANIAFNTSSNLQIGTIGSRWGWNEDNVITALNSNNIYIHNIYLKSNGDIDLEADNNIEIHHLEIGRNGSEVVLKAPKVVIDELVQSSSASGTSTITIYANEVDIETIDLGQQATFVVHPFSSDSNVTFHNNSITASSSSTMIVDSGDYYTNSFSIPGTAGVSSIRAADNNQIVNLYINNDFTPGNNPGINSSGNGGSFGSLTPANFRMFINGDLDTGGGGTTFNALVYVEGSASLGSPTYLKGAISVGDDITIKNGSKFYYDTSIESSELGGMCDSSYSFDNSYSCNIFPSVLNSLSDIYTKSNTIYDTCYISLNGTYTESGSTTCSGCSCSTNCNSDSTCSIISAPKNRYTHNVFETTKTDNNTKTSGFTFTDLEYGNYIFDHANIPIHFNPSQTYTDNSTKLMILGDVVFNKNNQNIEFEAGDYYFKSLVINGNNENIQLNGDVRIFVKNNFEINGNNCLTSGSGKLFVYTEGNAIIGNSGVGNNQLHLYIYSKGDITFKNNSVTSDLYGAFTAEGDIHVDGNRVNFHYEADGLDDFGVGECSLCYDEHYLSVNGISMFGMTMCTPFTPCELDMPIKNTSDEELDNVKIVETYKSSYSFGFSWFSYYDTIDKSGNHIGNGATKSSSYDYSLFNIVDTAIDTTAIEYDFGDNYPTYSPGEDYYRAYKKDTMSMSFSFDFNNWKNNVVYLASFTDKSGREYSIQIDACPYVNEDKRPTGWLDAWDDYNSSRGLSDRNISTKVANKTFNLTLAFIPDSDVTTSSAAGIRFYLVDSNASSSHIPISSEDTLTIPSNIYTTTTKSYTINKAYKNVNVEFKVCANYTSSGGYILYPYANCATSGDCSDNFEESNICYRYFTSSDHFAIRPDKFEITGSGYTRADNNISFLTIKAIGYLDGTTTYYDENSSSLNISVSDDLCPASTLGYSFAFSDGLANINYLKYPEVGEIELNISERDGREFAIVDSDDTADSDRFITPALSNKITILPDHFGITIENVSNFGNFTYLSNDLNMSADMNATIKALNANNNITQNYTNNCYSKNITTQISHYSSTTMQNLNNIITQYSSNPKDSNISFVFDKSNFSNGVALLNLMINFDRNYSAPTNPFTLTLDTISVVDSNDTNAQASISQNLDFLYGKVFAKDIVTNKNDTNLSVEFEYYNNGWIKNNYHTNQNYGSVYSIFTTGDVTLGLNENTLNQEQNISVSLNNSIKPYKVKLHLNIPTWLWYSRYNQPFAEANITNTDCLTHPCNNIVFLGEGDQNWAGAGTDQQENNASTHTINTNTTDNLNKNKNYHKLNW